MVNSIDHPKYVEPDSISHNPVLDRNHFQNGFVREETVRMVSLKKCFFFTFSIRLLNANVCLLTYHIKMNDFELMIDVIILVNNGNTSKKLHM